MPSSVTGYYVRMSTSVADFSTVCFYCSVLKRALSISNYFLSYDLTILLSLFLFYFSLNQYSRDFFSVSGTLLKCVNPQDPSPDRRGSPPRVHLFVQQEWIYHIYMHMIYMHMYMMYIYGYSHARTHILQKRHQNIKL